MKNKASYHGNRGKRKGGKIENCHHLGDESNSGGKRMRRGGYKRDRDGTRVGKKRKD